MCRTLLPVTCLASLALILLTGLGCLDQLVAPKKPDLPTNLNWGDSNDAGLDSESVEATRISVPNATLEDLKARLRAFKGVEPLEESGFEYGFNGEFMKQVVAHWLDKYEWRAWESRLNSFQNFYTRIEGLRVHFMHAKPAKEAKKRLPLLILHGWPGSVFEFHKLLPLLTAADAEGVAFEVIAPSIPGYGWSEAPSKPGFGAAACARVFDKLMRRLGFAKYYVQGGDWGSVIGQVMAIHFPERLLGFHSSMQVQTFDRPSVLLQTVLGSFLPAGLLFSRKDSAKIYPFISKLSEVFRETGHFHLQSTRPDTVGHALSDSPVGLAAYILEKFSVWTDPQNRFAPDGNLIGPKAAFTLDELLTNVMIYWTTRSITSSLRLYKEVLSTDVQATAAYLSMTFEVPHGVASFPRQLTQVPERFIRIASPNLLRFADMDRGGHFAALELPDLLNSEVREFVNMAEAFHLAAEKELADAWYIN